jgi:hypothetical protein
LEKYLSLSLSLSLSLIFVESITVKILLTLKVVLLYPSLHFRMKNFETNDLAFSPKENFGDNSGLAAYVAKAIDPSLSWEDVKWLRKLTSLPIVMKGILRGLFTSLLERTLIS